MMLLFHIYSCGARLSILRWTYVPRRRSMKTVVFAVVLILSCIAIAHAESKEALASRFYDATTAKQIGTMARNAAAAILNQDPNKTRQSEIYEQWANESFGSPEYKAIYVQFLVENFSAEELTAMNEWAKSPFFLVYMNKWLQFPRWSAPRFQEFLKAKNPELHRRLKAEGFDPTK